MADLLADGLARKAPVQDPAEPWQHARTDARLINGGPNAPELCMLARDIGHDRPLPARGLVQLKVDGVRALWIDQAIVSREGVPLDCAGHCAAALHRLEAYLGEPYFFDGEYVEDDGFNATVKAVRKGVGAGVIWLFDALPLRLWRNNQCDLPIEHRLRRLVDALPHAASPFVGVLDHVTGDPAKAQARAAELIGLGYEGAVIKRAGSMYRRERGDDWLRIKASVQLQADVMDIALRDDGTLKALIVRAPDGQTIRVGTGWSRERAASIVALWHAGRLPAVRIVGNPIVGGGLRGVRYCGLIGEEMQS